MLRQLFRPKKSNTKSKSKSESKSKPISQFTKLKTLIFAFVPKTKIRIISSPKNSHQNTEENALLIPTPTAIPNQNHNNHNTTNSNVDGGAMETIEEIIMIPKLKNNDSITLNRKYNHKAQDSFCQNIIMSATNDMDLILADDDCGNEIELSELSETIDEYKGSSVDDINGAVAKLSCKAQASCSMMRSFEKRPEYTKIYPPPTLMEILSTITVDEIEQSVTIETKEGVKKRLDSVDQLFEFASVTLDYSNFYGYVADYYKEYDEYDLNEPAMKMHVSEDSMISSIDDGEDDVNEDSVQDSENCSWE